MRDDIKRLLDAFEYGDGEYKLEEVEEAVRLKDEITPHLLDILEKVAEKPWEYEEKKDEAGYMAHVYAVALLGYFGESRAHEIFVDLFSLPRDLAYDLFFEIMDYDVGYLLYATLIGAGEASVLQERLENLKGIAGDEKFDEFFRMAILDTLNLGFAGGLVPREELLEFYRSLLIVENPDADFTGYAVRCAMELYPEEIKKEILAAFDKDIVDTGFITRDSVEETFKQDKEEVLKKLNDALQEKREQDIHEFVQWACFFEDGDYDDDDDDDYDDPARGSAPVKAALKMPSGKKSKKKKKKRK